MQCSRKFASECGSDKSRSDRPNVPAITEGLGRMDENQRGSCVQNQTMESSKRFSCKNSLVHGQTQFDFRDCVRLAGEK